MMMNEGSENKWEVEALLAKLEIKKVMILMYHLQMNDMIKCEHTSIMQALLKSCKNQLYWWKYYMSTITWADKITICESTNMSLYCFFHDENSVLLIKLNVLIWEILLWNTVYTRMNLLILKARQLKCKFLNIKKTALHLWWKRKKHKNLFDKAH